MCCVGQPLPQTVLHATHCSPRNICHARANHSYYDSALSYPHSKWTLLRIYHIRGNQCTSSNAKNIKSASRFKPICRCNIALAGDNPSLLKHSYGFLAAGKRFSYHFLPFLFSVLIYKYLHSINYINDAKIQQKTLCSINFKKNYCSIYQLVKN